MIRSLLIQLRRRLLLQAALDAYAEGALGASGLLLAAAAVYRLSWNALTPWSFGVLGLAAAWTVIRVWSRWPTLPQVAAFFDRRAGTHDRLATALAFAEPPTPIHAAALAECEDYLRRHFDGRRCTPWSIPKALPWLTVPIISIALLQFLPHTGPQSALAIARAPDPVAIRTATELEAMARHIEAKPQEKRPSDLQKVAEALKRSASRLREEAGGETSAKATLRELSSIEEMLRAAREGNALETLGDALSKTAIGKEAGEALKKHDPKAADKLEELGKRLVEGRNNDQKLKQLEKAMASAAAQLGDHSGLGSAAGQAASAARSGNAAGTGQALQKMGQSVREMRDSGGNGGGGGSSREMQGMISKLQEMKAGREGGTPQPQSGGEGGEKSSHAGQVVVESGKNPKERGQQAIGVMGRQGKPGSELDLGTKKTPFGALPPGNSTQPGKKIQLAGTQGEGESLRAMIATVPGAEPARAGYKPLYDAARSAAEDALVDESVPIGSILFVKRYFDAIKPK